MPTLLSSDAIRAASSRPAHAWRLSLTLTLAAAFVAPPPLSAQTASAQAGVTRAYAIPAGPLDQVLSRLAAESGLLLAATPELVAGRQSNGVQGQLGDQQALQRALSGTGLAATQEAPRQFRLAPVPASTGQTSQLAPVTVTAVTHASAPPEPYAGGQVARGARLGMLGNLDMMSTPFSVTAYTAETIRNQQARSLTDVMANDPAVESGGPWYFDNFYIRGISVHRSEIGFDGLYGIASAEGVQLEGIERVEVLKGPSTLINGTSPRGTAGGAINLVPKRAEDTPITRLHTDFLSDGNVGAHVDLGRRFGADQAFGIRLNAAHRDGRTAVDNESLRASNVTLGLDYRSERLRVSADVGASDQFIRGAKSNFFVTSAELPDAPRGDVSVWPRWSYQDKEHVFGMLRAEYDVNDAITLGAAYGAAESHRKMNTPWGVLENTAGDISFSASALEEKTETRSGELNLRVRFDTGPVRHETVLALTDYRSDISGFQPQANYGALTNLYRPTPLPEPVGLDFDQPRVQLSDTRLRSYAVTDTLSMLDDRLLLTLGLRHQKIDVSAYHWQTGAFQTNYTRSSNTPAAGLVVKPWRDVSLYANYVEALAQGDRAPDTAVNANEVFAPFVSRQMEVGTKIDWGRYSTTLSAFQIRRPSGILGADNVYRIAGEQRNRGLELQVFGEPVQGLRVLGGVAWTRARLTETPDGQFNGNRASGMPDWSVKLGAELDIPQVPGLTATARVLHTSSIPFDAANTDTLPAWTRFDLGARYATRIAERKVVFRASVENVFNRRYWDSAPAYQVVTYAAPRTYMLSASIDF
ncbi:TonB-dependent receptor [Orrella dioscoreae]|uniref:Ferrichrome-iron receptor n=1 Tax=Orrella dioscoreae TaxID=1851544 RepID=A0A1C3JYH8_9BURK|nr:TonB-dependent receptor [Orrella dioscoreae]SBT24331.1 Ferrichrome-iron receptor [Orrella dioscoreae]SOE48013.1 Ferrichrome-iron receptor [Orrella dioscoreae]